jgi:hypothetical protein
MKYAMQCSHLSWPPIELRILQSRNTVRKRGQIFRYFIYICVCVYIYTYIYIFIYIYLCCNPKRAMTSSFMRFLEHTQPGTRLRHDNTKQLQETDIRAPFGVRNHNPSRRAAADLRLRLRGQWDRKVLR